MFCMNQDLGYPCLTSHVLGFCVNYCLSDMPFISDLCVPPGRRKRDGSADWDNPGPTSQALAQHCPHSG